MLIIAITNNSEEIDQGTGAIACSNLDCNDNDLYLWWRLTINNSHNAATTHLQITVPASVW